jgi:hypothetical protein
MVILYKFGEKSRKTQQVFTNKRSSPSSEGKARNTLENGGTRHVSALPARHPRWRFEDGNSHAKSAVTRYNTIQPAQITDCFTAPGGDGMEKKHPPPLEQSPTRLADIANKVGIRAGQPESS